MPASTPKTDSPADNWKALPKRILLGAMGADTVLILLYAITVGLTPTPSRKPLTFLFDLNGEGNVAAWFSGTQLFVIGLAFLLLALWFFQSDERIAPLRRLFFVCGLAFVYLSADEIGQIHENMSKVLQSWHWLNQVETKFLAMLGKKMHRLHGGSLWIPIFVVVGVALIWWLWPQFKLAWKLWRTEIFLLAAGFGILAFGAVVLEALGDLIPVGALLMRRLEVGVEEGFELVGASIMLYAVVRVLAAAGAKLLPAAVPESRSSSGETPEE